MNLMNNIIFLHLNLMIAYHIYGNVSNHVLFLKKVEVAFLLGDTQYFSNILEGNLQIWHLFASSNY